MKKDKEDNDNEENVNEDKHSNKSKDLDNKDGDIKDRGEKTKTMKTKATNSLTITILLGPKGPAGLLSYSRLTCQGYSCSLVSWPPTIRVLESPPFIPH